MQKQTIPLQGLLSASLFTLMSISYAQETVSSFEQSIINKNGTKIQTQTGTATTLDIKALTNELKTRGWEIQNKADGSLILVPQKPVDSSSDEKLNKNTETKEQWQQLQQKLKNAGWIAVLDSDGSMRLTPPNTVQTTKSEELSHTIKSDEGNFIEGTFKDTQQKLKESGWNVTNNSDGSILLYPPKNEAPKKLHPCPGIKTVVKVPLPVDSWQEAHDITQGWLDSKSIPNSTVGKIRKIFNVYIISIVSDKSPYALMHQIAIKKSNGAVIILN